MKKKKKADPLEKLVKLTKLLKQDKVSVESTKAAPLRGPNKWRSYDPKFGPKPEKPENVVKAGGMDVDPSLKEEYENWRKDKMSQQFSSSRMQIYRKGLAAAKERAAREQTDQTPPTPPATPANEEPPSPSL